MFRSGVCFSDEKSSSKNDLYCHVATGEGYPYILKILLKAVCICLLSTKVGCCEPPISLGVPYNRKGIST